MNTRTFVPPTLYFVFNGILHLIYKRYMTFFASLSGGSLDIFSYKMIQSLSIFHSFTTEVDYPFHINPSLRTVSSCSTAYLNICPSTKDCIFPVQIFLRLNLLYFKDYNIITSFLSFPPIKPFHILHFVVFLICA